MGYRVFRRFHTLKTGHSLQRLFSTFPDGWPGIGLLLLRGGAAGVLIYCGAGGLVANPVLRVGSVTGGTLLLAGLWTPVAGAMVALVELGSAFSLEFSHPADRCLHLLLAVVAGAVAMLGPGAWSIDARLFGRKRFAIGGRRR
jgi:putative oxidoreductase